jgi:diguanylate cyclase (GGDEF)-like protein/PAS domain S-box-containing protein
MKPKKINLSSSRMIPIKIIFPYTIVAFLWAYFSNTIVLSLVHDHKLLEQILPIKAYFFFSVSSVFLYSMFRAATHRLTESEKRYRHLFENAAASILEEDFSAVKVLIDQQKALGVKDWKTYFDDNPQIVKECVSLVTITDFNQAVMKNFGVKNKDEVPRALEHYLTESSMGSFKEQLIALASGAVQWEGERTARSLKGDLRELLVQMSVAPGCEEDFSRVLVSILDITESKNAAKIVQLKEQRLRQIIDLVPHFVFAKDINGRFVLVNRAIADFYGTTVEGLTGKTDADFIVSPKEVHHFLNDDSEVIRSGKLKYIPLESITNAQGQTRLLSTTKIPFTASGIDSPCVLGVAVDITDYKFSEEALLQSRHFVDSILNSTPNLIYVYDLISKKNVYSNRGTQGFLGYTPQQIQDMGDQLFFNILHPEDHSKVIEHHQMISLEGKVREIEYRMKDAHGQWRCLRSRDVLFARTPKGEPWQILGSAEDITEHKHLESNFLTLTYYDALTTFPNRTLFFERANMGLSHARRSNTSCAVFFVDLDHFKNVNDTLGHSVGDELLKDTAVKLAQCVREIDTIARLGGDKFIVFLNGLEDAQSAQHIAERVHEKLNSWRLIAGHDLFVTASVGIAAFPNDGNNLEDLLKNADTAMFAAKEAGRNTYCFFDDTMNKRAVSRMQIERGLRIALSKNEFKLFYQPIIGVQNGGIRGFEALLRWFRGDGVLVAPNDFIYIAEETGLIVPIGEWVLKEACQMGRKLNDLGYEDIVMSVNISVVQLRSRAIIDVIKNSLEQTGLPSKCLEIEVTESILINSFDTCIEILKEIRDLGVKISLDDFGTGYSSLGHLQRLPITTLKIDRLFIKELMNQGVELAMTATIIDLAHTLNLGVIAEGVEFDLQLKSLAREQCDYFQGFLFGKPMPEEKAITFLEENCSSS